MAGKSKIEWCTDTWNPIVGCSVVSPGCTNCYAMKQAARIERMNVGRHALHAPRREDIPASVYDGLTKETKAGAVWTGDVRIARDEKLALPLRWKRGRKVFVNSMGDLFHESVPDAWIDRVFAVMALAPQHTFIVLTKRSKRMLQYVSAVEQSKFMNLVCSIYDAERLKKEGLRVEWPLPTVWLGVSAEDQTRANDRIPDLLATPAAVRFVSAEPLLGPIDFNRWLYVGAEGGIEYAYSRSNMLRWIIAGGESGPHARPMRFEWARAIRDQCAAAAVPFFFKQIGDAVWAPDIKSMPGGIGPGFGAYDHCKFDMNTDTVRVGKKRAGRLLDGREHNDMPETRG